MLAAQIGALSGTAFAEYFSVAIGTHKPLLVGAATLLLTAMFTPPMHTSLPDESRQLPQETVRTLSPRTGVLRIMINALYTSGIPRSSCLPRRGSCQ